MNTKSSNSNSVDSQFLLSAYRSGFFPMADSKTGEIRWYSPDPRGIFDLNAFKVPRSLRQTIKKNIFEVRVNEKFEEVMRQCGEREETWISDDIIRMYVELHRLGFAHSVESWKDGKLSGGLYGVAMGGAFFGESMFSLARDASKVSLVALVERLKQRGFELLDTQWTTPHLVQFGAVEIPRKDYLKRLAKALQKNCPFI